MAVIVDETLESVADALQRKPGRVVAYFTGWALIVLGALAGDDGPGGAMPDPHSVTVMVIGGVLLVLATLAPFFGRLRGPAPDRFAETEQIHRRLAALEEAKDDALRAATQQVNVMADELAALRALLGDPPTAA